jgi:hypothetical protein
MCFCTPKDEDSPARDGYAQEDQPDTKLAENITQVRGFRMRLFPVRKCASAQVLTYMRCSCPILYFYAFEAGVVPLARVVLRCSLSHA